MITVTTSLKPAVVPLFFPSSSLLPTTPRTSLPFPLSGHLPLSPLLHRRRHGPTTLLFGTAAGKGRQEESRFLDEDGAVKDMDGYLNHLSLEYDSVWDTKPSWCQPWTILLTGAAVSSGSWVILKSVLFTAVVSILICTWWYIFLYAYPKEYSNMIAERRSNVASGSEDTFGDKKPRN